MMMRMRQSNKLYHGSYEKLEIGINSKRKNFGRGENLESHIYISNDATHI